MPAEITQLLQNNQCQNQFYGGDDHVAEKQERGLKQCAS